jgi:hypothetical protein
MSTENSPTERLPSAAASSRPVQPEHVWAEYLAAVRPIADAQQVAREQQAEDVRRRAEEVSAASTELRRVAVRRGAVEGQLAKITEFTRATLAEAAVPPEGPRDHIPLSPMESVDDVGQAAQVLTEDVVRTTNLLRAARGRAQESARLRQRYLLAGAMVLAAVVLVKAAGGTVVDALASGIVVLVRQGISHLNRRGHRAVMTSGGVALAVMLLVTSAGGSWPVAVIVLLIVSAVISRRK